LELKMASFGTSIADRPLHLRANARTEAAHLSAARRHVAAAEKRVAAQRARITRLEDIGAPLQLAESLLSYMEAALATMKWHQTQIENELSRVPATMMRHLIARKADLASLTPHDIQVEATLGGSLDRIEKSQRVLARFADPRRRSTLP
jgi:hypothetical protein